jgi:hypothetical protein
MPKLLAKFLENVLITPCNLATFTRYLSPAPAPAERSPPELTRATPVVSPGRSQSEGMLSVDDRCNMIKTLRLRESLSDFSLSLLARRRKVLIMPHLSTTDSIPSLRDRPGDTTGVARVSSGGDRSAGAGGRSTRQNTPRRILRTRQSKTTLAVVNAVIRRYRLHRSTRCRTHERAVAHAVVHAVSRAVAVAASAPPVRAVARIRHTHRTLVLILLDVSFVLQRE